MYKFVQFLLILSAVTGCASAPRVPMQDISYPPLNTPSTAYLGDRLLMQGSGVNADMIRVNSLRGKFVSIHDQTFCQRVSGSNEYVSFNINAVMFFNFIGGYRGATNRVKLKRGELCISDMWSGCFSPSEADFQYVPSGICSHPKALQQIIEYNGRSGDTLNFTYREVYGERVSAPLTQNFTMDLTAGNVINYKGARLRIDQASNQEISYSIIRNFTTD
ncbi:MAG: hypothetical protein AAF541_06760 [Pseudomonadota bacterium]